MKTKKKDQTATPEPEPTTIPEEEQAEATAKTATEASSEAPPSPAEPDPVEMRLLRLQADFDNFRKRMIRERQEWTQRAIEDLLQELLPVLDHFEMGLQTAEKHETDPAVQDGFRMVYAQLLASLKKSGLEVVEAEGKPFDPHLHEAITHVPTPDHEPDMVISQTRRGYLLGQRLLRAAQVVISSTPPELAPEAGEQPSDHQQED